MLGRHSLRCARSQQKMQIHTEGKLTATTLITKG
jgi:hypothetical protein